VAVRHGTAARRCKPVFKIHLLGITCMVMHDGFVVCTTVTDKDHLGCNSCHKILLQFTSTRVQSFFLGTLHCMHWSNSTGWAERVCLRQPQVFKAPDIRVASMIKKAQKATTQRLAAVATVPELGMALRNLCAGPGASSVRSSDEGRRGVELTLHGARRSVLSLPVPRRCRGLGKLLARLVPHNAGGGR
jgi:hypothetical protein